MSRAVNVFVKNEKGYGDPSVRVNIYSGEEKKTDSDGLVSFIVKTPNVTVYVDGFEAYSGQTCDAPDPIIYTKK